MAESYKVCPICDTPNHQNASVCSTCGTSLAHVDIVKASRQTEAEPLVYDFRHGETDLFEGNISNFGRLFTLIVTGIVVIGIGSVLLMMIGPQLFQPAQEGLIPDVQDTATLTRVPFVAATVTQGPPTATVSPTPSATPTITQTFTPEPCMQKVLQGDSLIGIAIRCGHQSMDVIPLIVEINGLADQSSIQSGQTIEVPWPTPTFDPNAVPTETPEGSGAEDGRTVAVANSGDNIDDIVFTDPFAPTPTATLLPGVQWHNVVAGENIIVIAVEYNADMKVLSELNPEINFARCEFGQRFGGPECLVQLSVGQQVRVPAPTPTPTLSPTPSGSETPTPTPTATFNAPSAIAPSDGQFFAVDELVTLRWIPTGTLGKDQTYRVHIEDITAGLVYEADVPDLYFILPPEWQGADNKRHTYRWTVSVIDIERPDSPYHTTEPKTFVWQGLAESKQ